MIRSTLLFATALIAWEAVHFCDAFQSQVQQKQHQQPLRMPSHESPRHDQLGATIATITRSRSSSTSSNANTRLSAVDPNLSEVAKAYQRFDVVTPIEEATQHLQDKLSVTADLADVANNVDGADGSRALAAVNEFIAAVKDQFDTNVGMDKVLAATSADASSLLDKTPALTDYLKDAVSSSFATDAASTTVASTNVDAFNVLANAQTKFAIMADNTRNLPSTPKMTYTFSASPQWQLIQNNAVHTLHAHGSWIVAACAMVIMTGQKQAGFAAGQRKVAAELARHAKSLLEMADTMQEMSMEIQQLNDETVILQKDVHTAEEQLRKRTIQIKRERNRMAQQMVFARRRIYRMKTKVEKSEARMLRLEMKLEDRLAEKSLYAHDLELCTQRMKELIDHKPPVVEATPPEIVVTPTHVADAPVHQDDVVTEEALMEPQMAPDATLLPIFPTLEHEVQFARSHADGASATSTAVRSGSP